MTLWVNGELVADDAPVLRADDHGLVVGDGVFETAKIVNGVVFARRRHLDRLRSSAAGLGLRYDENAVAAGIDAVLQSTPGQARLRITVTGGPSPYSSARGDGPASVVVATSPFTAWPTTADLVVVPWTRNERAATAGLKTTSYADNVIALAYAHDRGGDEALFLNTRNEVCEGTGSNVFLGINGTLVTPPLDSGCLAGITRELVLEWVGNVVERPVSRADLAGADEVFITSSTRDIQAVRRIDDRTLPQAPGPLTEHVAARFAEHSAADADP